MQKKIRGIYEQGCQFIQNIQTDWQNKRRAKAVFKALSPFILIALVAGLIWTVLAVIASVWHFLQVNYTSILVTLLILACLYFKFEDIQERKIQRKQEEEAKWERERQEAIREKNRTQEATYKKMAKVIYAVARELGSLGIVPPNRLSDLYSPSHMIPEFGGEVQLGLYLLQKSREDVDTDLLEDTMQTKVNQKLSDGEFPGIPRDCSYKGRVYSGFAIDSVKDGAGFIEVYTALADEAYCHYKLDGDLDRDAPPPAANRGDMDY